MPYCTIDDLKARLPEEKILQLTDDENIGVISQARVDKAIADADSLIDGYLCARYTLPLASTPVLIAQISVDLTIGNLYARRLDTQIETVKDRVKNAMKLLEQISKGLVSLGIETSATPQGGTFQTNKTTDDRVFDKGTLDQW